MRRLHLFSAALIFCLSIVGYQASAQDISFDAFVELVQTGTLTEVEDALNKQPDLAVMQDKYGFTALHMLDYAEFEPKLTLLLGAGADINAVNGAGRALLHIIIDPDHIPAVVAAGGDINLRDMQGRTPVMIQLLEPDAFHFLPAYLAAGANPNARDDSGKSVLDYAEAFGDSEIIAMLIDAGARP